MRSTRHSASEAYCTTNSNDSNGFINATEFRLQSTPVYSCDGSTLGFTNVPNLFVYYYDGGTAVSILGARGAAVAFIAACHSDNLHCLLRL